MDLKDLEILKLLGTAISVSDLCSGVNLFESELRERIEHLRTLGYLINCTIKNHQVYYFLSHSNTSDKIIKKIDAPSSSYRFLAICDTHYGCKYDDMGQADLVANYAVGESISDIYHLGDMIESAKYISNLKIFSTIEQLDYVIQNFPKDPSLHYSILFGNHDAYSLHKEGLDISKYLCLYRDDFESLGYTSAALQLYDSYILFLHQHHDFETIRKFAKNHDSLKLTLSGHFHLFKNQLVDYLIPNLKLSTLLKDHAEAYDFTIPSDFSHVFVKRLTLSQKVDIKEEITIPTKMQ